MGHIIWPIWYGSYQMIVILKANITFVRTLICPCGHTPLVTSDHSWKDALDKSALDKLGLIAKFTLITGYLPLFLTIYFPNQTTYTAMTV